MEPTVKLTFSHPFPDQCGWFKAASHERKWHLCQAAHYFERDFKLYAFGHMLVAIPYHIAFLDCFLYVVTYIAYSIFSPNCMQKILEQAKKEQNSAGLALLEKRGIKIRDDEELPKSSIPYYLREEYHKRMKRIFEQRERNCPLLIGEKGVGKTAIATSFPKRNLIHFKVLSQEFLDFVQATENPILIIDHLDEIDQKTLNQLLRIFEHVQKIACCRNMGIHQIILERHFTLVNVLPANQQDTLAILKSAFPKGEETDFQKAISLARGPLPGSAVELYDECPSPDQLEDYAVNKYHLIRFSEEKIAAVENFLKERIIGQDHVITKVAPALRLIARGKGARGAFHFAGLTGTGKTELAKVIAEWLFGTREKVLQIAMGEYTDPHQATTLLGGAASYVGYEDGGTIQEFAKKHQAGFVLLLDDIHQGHPAVLQKLLQRIAEEKKLFDPLTRTDLDMSNVFIILTSNLGQKELLEVMNPPKQSLIDSFFFRPPETLNWQDPDILLEIVKPSIEDFVNQQYELLNRFETVPFSPIYRQVDIDHITLKLLEEEKEFLNLDLRWSGDFVESYRSLAQNPKEGIRSVCRYIQTTLRDKILSYPSLEAKQYIQLDWDGQTDIITVLRDS